MKWSFKRLAPAHVWHFSWETRLEWLLNQWVTDFLLTEAAVLSLAGVSSSLEQLLNICVSATGSMYDAVANVLHYHQSSTSVSLAINL